MFDAQQVAFLDGKQATVSVGWTGSRFVENMLTILAELRGALAIYSPASVLSVALA